MKEIFNPFSVTVSETKQNDLVMLASSNANSYREAIPRSPVSGEPMQLILCGPAKETKFKAWAHLKDRIILPYRGN